MKIIDVTLRDGGHAVDFNWPIPFAKEYYQVVSKIVDYVELGYWMQSEKSTNPFYNLDMGKVVEITGGDGRGNVSIMIDYHYCNKDISVYPTTTQNEITMIRLCARKEDIDDAIIFGGKLKEYTGLNVSFNIFNASNYDEKEIIENCNKVSNSNFDFIYFADTHGSMNLKVDIKKFKKGLDILQKSGKSVGIHLHDHLGKAYYNYQFANEYDGFDFSDTSVRGMGKGAGNLKLEYIKTDDELIGFINNHSDLLQIHPTPWEIITAKYSLTDNYAKEASNSDLPIPTFIKFCKTVKNVDKDSYNINLISDFLKKNKVS